jgi:cytochrome c biogenesis protein CcmG/thiol:disulfide interchange protein DsbE
MDHRSRSVVPPAAAEVWIKLELMARRLWFVALAAGSFLTGGSLQAQTPGTPAPGFTLKSLDGTRDSLSHYKGRPVLINFWASWCTPCRTEMPFIIDAAHVHPREQLSILAINLTDQEGSGKDVRKFVTEFAMPFPVLLDEKGKTRKHYNLRGVPTTVLVGSDGLVRWVNQGPVTESALKQHLADILPPP